VCVVHVDYDDSVAADCVVSPLTVTDTNSQVFVTAFYSAAESRDAVACSNGSTSSTYVYVVSLTSVERRSDDVRRRLPRIRVNVVSAESSVSAGNSYEGLLQHTELLFTFYRVFQEKPHKV